MKKDDKIYLMENKAIQELKEKYGLEIRLYELISKDLHDDGNNLACFHEKDKNTLYYIQVYMLNNEPKIYSCEKFIKESKTK
jgi:hypothetical protein